jgi:hypothetical protein
MIVTLICRNVTSDMALVEEVVEGDILWFKFTMNTPLACGECYQGYGGPTTCEDPICFNKTKYGLDVCAGMIFCCMLL